MKQNKTYQDKIRGFIILITLISQLFMFFTISGSYIFFKHSRNRDMLSALSDSYEQSLNSLSAKIDNMLYMFDTSGALSFCASYPSAFDSEEAMRTEYNRICRELDYSSMNNYYFPSYYLIGSSFNPLSIVKDDGVFLYPSKFNFDYSFIYQNLGFNEFTENYQRLFYLNKEACSNIKVPSKYTEVFSSFLDELDGKLVYCSLRDNVFCILVINDSLFDDIFKVSYENSISVVLKNTENETIYHNMVKGEAADAHENHRNTINITSDRYILTLIPHTNFSFMDFLFVFIALLLCCAIVVHAIYRSKHYAAMIMRPYQIVINFFRLNKELETFDKSLYHDSVHTRSETNKLFFRTFVHTILIPSLLSLFILSGILYGYTTSVFENNIDSIHENTVTELRDSFDTFIVQNFLDRHETSESFSRSAYTVKLNADFYIESMPFKDKEYISSKLNAQLRKIKPLANNGVLVSLHSDMFNDKAIGIIHKAHDDGYLLSVVKSRDIASIKTPSPISYILTDSENSIIAQSSSVSKESIISVPENTSNRLIRRYVFPEYNWTLHTFADSSIVNIKVVNTCLLNGLVIALLLLIIFLITWHNAISFVQPFEKIIKSMLKNDIPRIGLSVYNGSEIEELISVYNDMLSRINNITNEQLNSLKIQTEMNALQHQINPHFLYNTLNMISLNATSFTADDIMKITSTLSDIFRYSTDVGDGNIFLGDEFNNLDNYIYIWSMRFPERFHIKKDIESDAEMIPSIKLILQPIVENCFMHAFDNMPENCTLSIKSYIEDDNVVISIEDNGHGIEKNKLIELQEKIKDTSQPLTGKGIGMRNVYQRLMLAYGDAFSFSIESIEGQGTTVTIKYDIYVEPNNI